MPGTALVTLCVSSLHSTRTQAPWPQVGVLSRHHTASQRQGWKARSFRALFQSPFFVRNAVSHQPTALTQRSGCGLMRDTVLARTECRLSGQPDQQPPGGNRTEGERTLCISPATVNQPRDPSDRSPGLSFSFCTTGSWESQSVLSALDSRICDFLGCCGLGRPGCGES